MKLAFLFSIGSTFGWLIEVIFRRFFSKNNTEKKWINPGFLRGPWLPLYGFGLCLLYIISELENYFVISGLPAKVSLFLLMAASMTAIEYISGVFSSKLLNARLWDYSDEWANLQGLICPKFSFFWSILGMIYYFFIHRYAVYAVERLLPLPIFTAALAMYSSIYAVDIILSLRSARKTGHLTKT